MYMRMKFYVDGTKRKGTVHLDLKKVRSAANVLRQAHTIALYSGTWHYWDQLFSPMCRGVGGPGVQSLNFIADSNTACIPPRDLASFLGSPLHSLLTAAQGGGAWERGYWDSQCHFS